MKSATVIVAFRDLLEEVPRNPGDVFQVEDERADYLSRLGFVTLKDVKPTRKKKTVEK